MCKFLFHLLLFIIKKKEATISLVRIYLFMLDVGIGWESDYDKEGRQNRGISTRSSKQLAANENKKVNNDFAARKKKERKKQLERFTEYHNTVESFSVCFICF